VLCARLAGDAETLVVAGAATPLFQRPYDLASFQPKYF
jgi:hypothetical protein